MVHRVHNVRLEEKNKLVSMEKNVKDMKFLYTNADGMLLKKLENLGLTKKKNAEIVCLGETKLERRMC